MHTQGCFLLFGICSDYGIASFFIAVSLYAYTHPLLMIALHCALKETNSSLKLQLQLAMYGFILKLLFCLYHAHIRLQSIVY
jgi:hypothetical protein